MNPSRMFAVAIAIATASSARADAPAPGTGAPRSVDPKADALLRSMSAQLARMKTFVVETNHSTEVVTKDGQKVELLGDSKVTVERPNKLRSERAGADRDVIMYYDGKTISLYGKRANLYATTAAPNTIDKAIDFARDRLDLEAPAADLLYADAYQALMDDVVSGTYVDKEQIGDRMCHHLAYRGNETDWQIWIEDGPRPLPCRFEITSKNEPGQPEFVVTINHWTVDPALPADTFVFNPPRGASRIDFMAVAQGKQHQEAKR